ncbi:hypothetical protein JN12_03946 [Geobacter argillaceus]|uniref:Uncharacterized protein n=1 Tax=Geobacter argillaceus TaxID=345631 RepID=A0A562V5V7_9BACT|nr:hypothetical protein JN12_03946 [Geobacter argillaceus]
MVHTSFSCAKCGRRFRTLDYFKGIGFGIFKPACLYSGLIPLKCSTCGSESRPRNPYLLILSFAIFNILVVALWSYVVIAFALSWLSFFFLIIVPYLADYFIYRVSKFEQVV